ncbi:MAG: sigma-54-dependent Fis family transcriptional regulator [Oleiphilaceae bacterium]|nr:sigma-54-dependent Fis family transcriptional regulator [Oleiphilaceae bacterium]
MKDKRPLVWLSSAPCRSKHSIELGSHWHVHPLDMTQPPVNSAVIPNSRVGILDFSEYSAASDLTRLDQWFDTLRLPHWVGILASPPQEDKQLRALVSQYCSDYHRLPIDCERLNTILGHLWGMAELQMPTHNPTIDSYQPFALEGPSTAISRTRSLLRRFGQTHEPVLIHGESGTGKEAAARFIHTNSPQRHAPLITINCAALPLSLTQSELFGYEKGAFTGATTGRPGRLEAADGGTLLIAGIDELKPEQQSALLLFLQEGLVERIGAVTPRKVTARVIATSTAALDREVAAGRFRGDVYYRLGELEIQMPALRNRREDILFILKNMIAGKKTTLNIKNLSLDSMHCLLQHDWPGNLQELQNRLAKAFLLGDRPLLEPWDFGLAENIAAMPPLTELRLERYRDLAEQEALSYSLTLSHQNVSAAARLLGISRVSFYRLMAKHDPRKALEKPKQT